MEATTPAAEEGGAAWGEGEEGGGAAGGQGADGGGTGRVNNINKSMYTCVHYHYILVFLMHKQDYLRLAMQGAALDQAMLQEQYRGQAMSHMVMSALLMMNGGAKMSQGTQKM